MSEGHKGREYKLRSEAGVLKDTELTDEQRKAYEQLVALIDQMLKSEERIDTPVPLFLPRIDAKRSNRVLLIDGGRGSGKTALLVTVIARWRRALMEDPDASAAAAVEKGASGAEELGQNPRGRIVPVGLLDLHPLPPSTNLLFHIIGRFERVVEWLEGDGKSDMEPAAWNLAGANELASRKRWREMLRAAAAGWDGNVKERGARLDLEAYALELEEAERQRLNVVDSFTAFLGALVEDFARRRRLGKNEPPLFVLAVDDADMDPSRAVELLETVRMLWHPRLAFVLTGDSPLFLQTLSEHCLAEIRRPLQGHCLGDHEIAEVSVGRSVRGLATDIYDKIVPYGHRCQLPPISPRSRLEHVREAFESIHIEASKKETLASYFSRSPQLCEALPDRLRGLMDLADVARAAVSGAPLSAEPASRVVEAIWQRAAQSLSKRIDGFSESTVRFEEATGAFEIQMTDFPVRVWASDPRLKLHTIGPTSLNLVSVGRLDGVQKTGNYLPTQLAAALMLAADVSADQTNSSWNEAETSHNGYEPIFAWAYYRSELAAAAMRFSWPLPPGCSLPFYAAFSSRWTRELLDAPTGKAAEPPGESRLDKLARHFLFLVVYLWRGSTTLSLAKGPPDWLELARLVSNLSQLAHTPWRNWALKRAGLIAAPEYGLPADMANKWLVSLYTAFGDGRWRDIAEGLRAERRARLDGKVGRPEMTLTEIDDKFPQYEWARMVEKVGAELVGPSKTEGSRYELK